MNEHTEAFDLTGHYSEISEYELADIEIQARTSNLDRDRSANLPSNHKPSTQIDGIVYHIGTYLSLTKANTIQISGRQILNLRNQ